MRTDIREERLVVISDLHLGNPFSEASRSLSSFLDYVLEQDYHLIINGDGLEILQADLGTLARSTSSVAAGIRRLVEADRRVYYIVGNHDIALEHLLGSWLGENLRPFLNVRSGDLRIRVEHGHLYDPFFFKYPTIYEWVTRMAGPILRIRPELYEVWIYYQRFKRWLGRHLKQSGRRTQPTPFHEGAAMLLRRGFDAVVFGHTHKPEVVEMEGGVYINGGNWVKGGTYVEIDRGVLSLKRWEGPPKSLPGPVQGSQPGA